LVYGSFRVAGYMVALGLFGIWKLSGYLVYGSFRVIWYMVEMRTGHFAFVHPRREREVLSCRGIYRSAGGGWEEGGEGCPALPLPCCCCGGGDEDEDGDVAAVRLLLGGRQSDDTQLSHAAWRR